MIAKYLITIMFDISGFFNLVNIARVLLPNESGFMALEVIMTLTPQRKQSTLYCFYFYFISGLTRKWTNLKVHKAFLKLNVLIIVAS